jgi:hypothetical protein
MIVATREPQTHPPHILAPTRLLVFSLITPNKKVITFDMQKKHYTHTIIYPKKNMKIGHIL